MKIHYLCDCCGDPIDILEVEEIDEAKLGFDCLTGEERQEIIRFDAGADAMYVHSLCDFCIEAMGLADPGHNPAGNSLLH
ncbi:MAG: anti-sigma-F factor Fin family protein [Negativicutes bacterium]|nr:anti-sigma-F factor Fin family protein [Negativicutes bacterium]